MRSPLFVSTLGVVLFFVAVAQHISEIATLNTVVGPAIALALDGLAALGLVYGGYYLSQTELAPLERRRVFGWSIGGALIFAAVIGATFLVRTIEGRVIAEPLFPLLIAVEVGAIAGLVAGYYSARARVDARRAQAVTDGLTFVNSLIRHDLRNDLSVIHGHAELLETQQPATAADRDRDSPTVIAEKADEALTRIKTTRAIAETLVGDPDLESIDLAAVTAELAARFETTQDVTVQTDLPDDALVAANPGIRSVVDNILENAIEHNDANDRRVAVAIKRDADTIELTVTDNGPGVPEAQKKALQSARTTEPNGGGLTLIQTLVEAYDGTIRVADNEPCGSRFIVRLPRAEGRP